MTNYPKIHFSTGGGIAECGSSRDTTKFTVVPEEVTCTRCQKTYKYLETVDALTRPDGEAPRFTRPAYATKETIASVLVNHPVDSPAYQKAVKEYTTNNTAIALENANRQAREVVAENEPLYELSYTVVSTKVKQSQLIDYMESLIAAKATNVKLVQIRG